MDDVKGVYAALAALLLSLRDPGQNVTKPSTPAEDIANGPHPGGGGPQQVDYSVIRVDRGALDPSGTDPGGQLALDPSGTDPRGQLINNPIQVYTPPVVGDMPPGSVAQDYPSGTVFYDPVTGKAASFSYRYSDAVGNIIYNISDWSKFFPDFAIPTQSRPVVYDTPAEDYFPVRFDGSFWYDVQGTMVSPIPPWHRVDPPGTTRPGAAGDWLNPNSPDYRP